MYGDWEKFQSLAFTARGGGDYGVTGSFGIAEIVAGMSSAALLEEADQAQYRAKQTGRNRVALAGSMAQPSAQPAG